MIYFVRCGDWVKIGYTKGSVSARLADLQTGSPHKLELLGKIDGTRFDEQCIHGLFRKHRGRGEWFKIDVLSEIFSLILLKDKPTDGFDWENFLRDYPERTLALAEEIAQSETDNRKAL